MLDDGGGESAQYMENETRVCLLMCAVVGLYEERVHSLSRENVNTNVLYVTICPLLTIKLIRLKCIWLATLILMNICVPFSCTPSMGEYNDLSFTADYESSAPLFPLHSHGTEKRAAEHRGKIGIRRRDFLLRSQCSPDRACGKFVISFL